MPLHKYIRNLRKQENRKIHINELFKIEIVCWIFGTFREAGILEESFAKTNKTIQPHGFNSIGSFKSGRKHDKAARELIGRKSKEALARPETRKKLEAYWQSLRKHKTDAQIVKHACNQVINKQVNKARRLFVDIQRRAGIEMRYWIHWGMGREEFRRKRPDKFEWLNRPDVRHHRKEWKRRWNQQNRAKKISNKHAIRHTPTFI